MQKHIFLVPIVIILLLGSYLYFFHDNVPSYTIKASAEVGGDINPCGEISITRGNSQVFTVTPDTEYHIANVLVDGVSVGAVDSYEFTDVTADHTIAASFEADEYTLTVNIVGGGSVSLDPSRLTYQNGDVVELRASADPGWVFGSWSGDLSGLANPKIITVDGEKTVTATFTKMASTITASAGSGGSIDPVGNVVVVDGGSQSFTISPDSGYRISDVLVDGVSVGAVVSYEFTGVTVDHMITASFEADVLDHWIIAASAGSGGYIDPSGDVSVTHGANQAFNVAPNAGYHILDVVVDGGSVGEVNYYEFTAVSANHTIEAFFEKTIIRPSNLTHLWSYPGEVYDIEVSHNGEYLVASSAYAINYYKNNDPEPIWRAISIYEAIFWDVALSNTGDYVAVGDEVGVVNYYSDASAKEGYIFPSWSSNSLGRGIRRGTLDISKSGDVVAVVGKDGMIHIYKGCTAKTGINLVADWMVDTSATDIIKLVLDSDGKQLVACGSIKVGETNHIIVSYLDIVSDTILWYWISPFPGTAHDVQLSGDGNVVTLALTDYSTTSTGTYCWVNAVNLRGALEPLPSWMYTEKFDSTSHVAVSHNGKSIVAGSNSSIFFWSDARGQNGGKLSPDWSKPLSAQNVSISEDGGIIVASAFEDQDWQLVLFSKDGSIKAEALSRVRATSLATSGDCKIIAITRSNRYIDVYLYEP